MSKKARWILGTSVGLAIFFGSAFLAGRILLKRIEPMVREQAVRYLRERFHSNVELAELHIQLPKVSTVGLVFRKQRGALVQVEGLGLKMTRPGTDSQPMLEVQKLHFHVDIASVMGKTKSVDAVFLDGVHLTVPPKGAGQSGIPVNSAAGKQRPLEIEIQHVEISDAILTILPKDPSRNPLNYRIDRLHMTSVGRNSAMNYDADLSIPKPPGHVLSQGQFGPWNPDEPGDTALNGKYRFENADLSVFNGIAGVLQSTGGFQGTLDSITAIGEAYVPDFRLKMAGNPVPLRTDFECLVDGTNGNTTLQPVKAVLGTTQFTTNGAVIRHEKNSERSIDLDVNMPNGNLPDLLRLAMKGPAFMEGRITLKTRISIPPLNRKVKQKLKLDGNFSVRNGKFLRSTIQSRLDNLSRHAQGEPKNEEIDEVASNLKGSFRLENQVMTFRSVSFTIPGAKVALAGTYNLAQRTMDFRGTVAMRAHVSEMVTGWKSVVLKAVDPFFARDGAGTFLHIKIEGDAAHPRFGIDWFQR